MAELADNQVKLSDGRIVTMKEMTGADEVTVAQMLGDKVSLAGVGVQVLTQANTLKAIESIDGQAPPLMGNYNAFIAFARQFKSKDLQKLMKKYAEMNLELDEESNPLA